MAEVTSGRTKARKRKRRSATDEISIPLDNTITEMVVSVTAEDTADSISLQAPSGMVWSEGLNRLSNVAIYIVDSPVDGDWKLQIPINAGNYQYLVKVASPENINFDHGFKKKFGKTKTVDIKSPIAGK